MMGKALIASDLYIYKDLLTHGENALLIDPKKNHKLWFKYIKQLVLDTDLRNKLSNNLYNFVEMRYTLAKVTSDRCEWYKSILGR
jgi:glycosyltransferase involved in cell wall biosynthesis